MKTRIIGGLVLVVAALTLSATLASAAPSGYTISLTITPSAAQIGDSVTFTGTYADDGVGVPSSDVEWTRCANGTCSGGPDGSGFLTTTDSNGDYTFTSTNGLPNGPWSFETSAGTSTNATSPCREFISGASVAPATVPVDHMFLCYSKFEQDGGMVVTADAAPALIALGMWIPSAVSGNVDGGDNLGAYHLACNPDPTLKPTGQYVDQNGMVWDSTYALNSSVGVYPIVG